MSRSPYGLTYRLSLTANRLPQQLQRSRHGRIGPGCHVGIAKDGDVDIGWNATDIERLAILGPKNLVGQTEFPAVWQLSV